MPARALTIELNIPTVAAASSDSRATRGVLTVTYHPQSKELVVNCSETARGTVTRVVAAPDNATEVADLAVSSAP